MSTSLFAEFNTEFGIGQNEGWKSATGMPTSENTRRTHTRAKSTNRLPTLVFFWVLFKVDELIADFTLKIMHAWGEANKTDANFSTS